MDLLGYAEASALLLNADLPDVESLKKHLEDRAWLEDRGWLQARCTERDCVELRKFQRELRPVFDAASRGETDRVVSSMNDLLAGNPIRPRLSQFDDNDIHLHVSEVGSIAELLISESLLGLANLLSNLGANRLGICAAKPCTNVFVDASPNLSRRYCSDRCSSRANVTKFRARQKATSLR